MIFWRPVTQRAILIGVLVGLGAAVGEEGFGQVAGSDLLEQPAQLGADGGGGGGRARRSRPGPSAP